MTGVMKNYSDLDFKASFEMRMKNGVKMKSSLKSSKIDTL